MYRDNTDDIVGFVSVKTLMSLLSHWLGRAEEPPFNVVEHSEPPLFIHEAMPADDVLAEMSEHHTQMAIVVDEYGGTAGIVTREGLLDRLVGGVSEDPEDRNFDFEVISDDEVVLNGLLPVSEFEDRFHTKVDEDDYNTMGGLVFGRLGSAAQVGSTTTLEGFQAVVEEMDGLRIAKLRLHRTSEDQYMPAVQRSHNGAAPD
ncbi:MAG: transporter associated domain-containing protein [Chloroflexia bacterium]